MNFIKNFVDAKLNYDAEEKSFKTDLATALDIDETSIKSMYLYNRTDANKITQTLVIELRGRNTFKSENVAKIEGLSIITPNCIEIEVGDILL